MVETYTVPVSRKHRHDMADHSDMAMDLDPDSVIGTMVLDSDEGDVDTPLDLRAELHFRAKDVMCSTLPWHMIILRPRKLYTFSVADNARMLHSIKIRPANPAKPALSTITIATFRKSSMTPQTFRKLKLVTDPDMRTDFDCPVDRELDHGPLSVPSSYAVLDPVTRGCPVGSAVG